MAEKILVGPINKGLKNDVKPFVIDNDSFPTLINAYQWRGRVKRKRGTSLLGILQRAISTSIFGNFVVTDGAINLLTMVGAGPNASLVPGSIVAPGIGYNFQFFMEPNPPDGDLNGSGGATGTINYSTGAVTFSNAVAGASNAQGIFRYYPGLPVMGLEELSLLATQFPGTLAFDTTYSYNILTTFPYSIYDVSFYKNPVADAVNLPGYIPKTSWTDTTWNGQDYQQFWTVNYEGVLWATNGINVPFSITNIGMQYKFITGVAILTAGPPPAPNATANLTIVAHGLVVGDFVFINEVLGITGINYQTGYVIAVVDPNTVTVEFPFATLGGAYTSGGIAQYLTNRSSTTIDSLRWYDGDPTNQNPTTPTLVQGKGWVNFAPPLNILTLFPNFSIADLPPAQYYLVGARMIVPFKDRLLFMGPVIQTSVAGSQVYLQDTIIYSQNGTPFYTASFTGDPSLATTVFHPILTPTIPTTTPIYHTASPTAYWEDQTGFGGFISAGIAQPILTSSMNEDVLIVGFSNTQTRVVYSGNDLVPFNFYLINSELGSGSTFSGVNMDKGILTRGQRGFIITSQVEARRIDLDIPNQIFELSLIDNGNERVTAQRDFKNEWVYFTYALNENSQQTYFPSQTLQYNYRDDSWGIFNESYTTYGSFRKTTGYTWATIGTVYPTWRSWNTPWNSGSSTLQQPEIIAGNQQGFVIFRDASTDESKSLTIQSFTGSVVTSIDHGLQLDDYIIITEAIGTISTEVNGKIFSVASPTTDTFTLNPVIGTGTYFGGGVITRMYNPFIQTKQFPVSWSMSRKTRIGSQQYLLSSTPNSQITLLIFLSENPLNDDQVAYNDGPILPSINTVNDSLIYSTVLYTCPESTNLGLTPANTNLNMPTARSQNQIWHRINTSLIGDTIQLGFTMSDAQMRSLTPNGSPIAITGATKTNPSVLTTTAAYAIDQVIEINGVVGMTQLNENRYIVIGSTPTTITINVDASNFSTYISGGTTVSISPNNQFAEIEIHSFIVDVSPSMYLA